jgi:hypothetical protein
MLIIVITIRNGNTNYKCKLLTIVKICYIVNTVYAICFIIFIETQYKIFRNLYDILLLIFKSIYTFQINLKFY